MLTSEPVIKVGVLDRLREVRGKLNGEFHISGAHACTGAFQAGAGPGIIILKNSAGEELHRAAEIQLRNTSGATFTLSGVTIGRAFHWERQEEQTFRGDLRLVRRGDGTIAAINEVPLEDYLASVISSEMNAAAPPEFLKAHAIASRSWLAAMQERERKEKQRGRAAPRTIQTQDGLLRWYDREDHDLFEVCADDHCQRYQGVTKIISDGAAAAVRATRGVFLVYQNEICDARFSKACGGLTENFENCWEERRVPYLQCIADAERTYAPLQSEAQAANWILSKPDVFCNTSSGKILQQILPSFDQETADFFRWTIVYDREELENILRHKSGFDFGALRALIPVQRGPSGRIIKLKIVGSKQSLLVGKELEIRRWLSRSHLYSSAFIIKTDGEAAGLPRKFMLHGAGWGHGVGLCQIGAAMMAINGRQAEEIVRHYFRGAQLKKLY